MRYAKSPDLKTACAFLHEIAKRQVSFIPRKVDKQLILYGAGNLGKMAREYFERLGVPVLCVVDANPELHRCDPFWDGIDIFGIEDVPVELRRCALLAICVAKVSFSEVSKPLTAGGWCDVVPFYDIAEAYHDRHPLSNGWHSGVLREGDIYGIESVMARWEDDISRAHHLQFIAWHSLREDWFFDDAPVTTDDRYFIPQVLSVLNNDEVFVDVGAHHGQVCIRFLDTVKKQYKEIFAIEPDEDNFSQLRTRLQEYDVAEVENIHLLAYALGATTDEKRFYHKLGYASQFSDLGQTEVEVRCLDDLSIPATFIKMHIEGWEQTAISGGLNTIITNRPVLAVTSYHKRDGLWNLPAQIMTCLDNYAYYFRLHSWHGTGGVIYAIPRERISQNTKLNMIK